MSKCAAAFSPFFRTCLVLPKLCKQVLQRLLQFQHWSHITITMSTCAASVSPSFSTGHVLSTLYQQVLQRLIHFTALVSYYLHYVSRYCSDYFIFHHWSLITYNMSTCAAAATSFYSTLLLLPKICLLVMQRLVHSSQPFTYSLHSVNMCCRGYFNFQHSSRIT
jgi:hypothetical protein